MGQVEASSLWYTPAGMECLPNEHAGTKMSILVFLNGCCLNGSASHEILVENGSLGPLTILSRKEQVMGPVSQILAVLRFNKNSLVMFLFLVGFLRQGTSYVVQMDLNRILLPPRCWDYSCTPLCSHNRYFWINVETLFQNTQTKMLNIITWLEFFAFQS